MIRIDPQFEGERSRQPETALQLRSRCPRPNARISAAKSSSSPNQCIEMCSPVACCQSCRASYQRVDSSGGPAITPSVVSKLPVVGDLETRRDVLGLQIEPARCLDRTLRGNDRWRQCRQVPGFVAADPVDEFEPGILAGFVDREGRCDPDSTRELQGGGRICLDRATAATGEDPA